MAVMQSMRRNAVYVAAIARTLMLTHRVTPDANLTIVDWVERWARERPDAPAILHEERIVTYRMLIEGANRHARWALGQDIAKGQTVALLMENRPEFIMAWLGMMKIGAIAALINTHLKGSALGYCVGIAGAKHLILQDRLGPKLREALDGMETKPKLWVTGDESSDEKTNGAEDFDAALRQQSDAPMGPETRKAIFCRDKELYIYTSGTTGMPKAANISHMRFLHIMMAFQGAVNAGPNDRMYDVLPLYHSSGGICALGPVFLGGGSVVLREKFSASEFWDDCARFEPTLFQYIGELCRYLLNSPPHEKERAHKLRIAIGNGLRPEIWPKFKERFQVPHIMEFYGATEGNVGMINYSGQVGAVGRVPWYARQIQKIRLVRFDVAKQIPVRGEKGFCMETDDGEAGEAIGKIDQNTARARFDGYTKKDSTEKKILCDVFEKDDAWFRTGDLMRRDKYGYFYFVDRTGDSFRWKAENVSTAQVAEAISSFPAIAEANVYGVAVPGWEGKAGMAALKTTKDFDLEAFAVHLKKNLPSFAQPVFLRLRDSIDATSTFKQRKIELQEEGFDPTHVSDPLYARNDDGSYQKLTSELYASICEGKVQL
nr:MAG: long-chain-acyl-CoA synthetase [Hyphomicrobiales bacterium]